MLGPALARTQWWAVGRSARSRPLKNRLSRHWASRGRTRWRFAAGRNVALISHQLQPTRLDADTIAIRDAGGKLVALDLRSGSRRPLQPDAHGWCRAEILYRQSYRYPGTPVGTPSLYAGQPSLFPCTARQRRLPTPRRAARFVGEIGAAAHGLVAWADKTAVHAVPEG